MTAVAFHFGAVDKLAYVCRLLRKAVSSGSGVMVLSDFATQEKLDADLWAISSTDFVVHCSHTANASIRLKCPVLLHTDFTSASESEVSRYPVLLNLTEAVPLGFEVFPRVIEVVSTDLVDRNLARTRWKCYSERGYRITRHDLTLKGAS